MRRLFIFVAVFFFSVSVFAQEESGIRVIGRIPSPADGRLYQLQVGAFVTKINAEEVYEQLKAVSLDPDYEQYLDYTRVMLKGISAEDVPLYVERIRIAGFFEVIIRPDTDSETANRLRAIEEKPVEPVRTEPQDDYLDSDQESLWRRFRREGWFYELNGVSGMTNGYQKDRQNGVEITVTLELVNENGIPYLQMNHELHNPGDAAVTAQKFGVSSDELVYKREHSPEPVSSGIPATGSSSIPVLEFMITSESEDIGTYNLQLDNVDGSRRSVIRGIDRAIGFLYQNIDLAEGESKKFIVSLPLRGMRSRN